MSTAPHRTNAVAHAGDLTLPNVQPEQVCMRIWRRHDSLAAELMSSHFPLKPAEAAEPGPC